MKFILLIAPAAAGLPIDLAARGVTTTQKQQVKSLPPTSVADEMSTLTAWIDSEQ